MQMLIDCEQCRENKECDRKGDFQRQQFSAIASGKPAGCTNYEPMAWRGIEGVAA